MTNLPAAISTALLRAEIDAVLADWAWHLDHGDYDALAELFTEQALFVTGAVELRGRSAIKNRYTERLVARSTRHTYSGLRVYPVAADSSAAADGRPRRSAPAPPGSTSRSTRPRRPMTWASTWWPTSMTC